MPGPSPLDPQDPLAVSSPAGGPAPTSLRPPDRPTRTGSALGALGFSLAWLAVALGIGVAVGLAVGAATRATSEPSDGWGDLAAVVLGLFAGVLAAMTVWFVAMVLATRRYVPAGRRLGVLGWSVLAAIATPLLLTAAFSALGSPAPARPAVIAATVLAMVVVPPGLVLGRVAGRGATADPSDGSMAG